MEPPPDDDDDRAAARQDVTREQDLVEEEARALAGLVSRVVASDGAEAPAVHERFRQVLSKYQEEPQLLDGHLESLVSPLARLLRRRAALAAERQPAPPPGAGAPMPPLSPADAAAALDVGRLLGAVVTVRGAKAVARFLTHEAADLEVALGLLLRLEAAEKAAAEAVAAAAAATAAADDGALASTTTSTTTTPTTTAWSAAEGAAARSWPWQEAQAVVLLWLSLLALAPFDLAVLDSSLDVGAAPAASSSKGAPPPLARRLASACAARLHETGAAREMAALVIARLLTRPDMGALLAEFFEWQRGALARAAAVAVAEASSASASAASAAASSSSPAITASTSAAPSPSPPHLPPALAWPPFPTDGVPPAQAAARATFLVPGALRALGLAFKLGPRAACAPLAARAWEQLEALQEEEEGEGGGGGRALLSSSPLARRLVAKLAQRLALTLLPPPPKTTPTAAAAAAAASSTGPSAAEQQGDPPPVALELHEAVEGALGALLGGGGGQGGALGDRDTVVRWSGAKGVARVAAALPCPELSDEVVSSVLGSLFVEGGSDAAWHGGCLALAELARRGCLPPSRLREAAPLLARALAFDAPARGGCAAHSVGAHVRDAAAYACWALARAFGSGGGGGSGGSADAASAASAAVERAFLDSLAPALLAAACYDREVNCRRAAAAAFQEAVGRLSGGCLAHGLEALHAAQYSSVGQAQRAALRAAPAIAALGGKGGYRPALVEALVERQLRHWDGKGTRALAARALAALVPALAQRRGRAAGGGGGGGGGGEGDEDDGQGNGQGGDGGIALLTGEGGAVSKLLARVGPDSTLEERTGALMALGEVLPELAVAAAQQQRLPLASAATAPPPAPPPPPPSPSRDHRLRLRPADAAAASGLLPRVAACGLYRGRGGEATREAAARLLEGVSRAQEAGVGGGVHRQQQRQRWSLPLDAAHHAAARMLLDDCARQPSERVRRAGEAALRAYAASLVGAAERWARRGGGEGDAAPADSDDDTAYAADAAAASALPALEALVDRTWPERLLADALPVHRRGAAGALGALPAAFVAGALLPPPPPPPPPLLPQGQEGEGGGGSAGAEALLARRRARPEALLRALAAAALEGAEPDRFELPPLPPPGAAAAPAGAAAGAAAASLPAECRDAEARAEAAAALGRVCGELWGDQSSPPERGRGRRDSEEEEEEEEAGEEAADDDDGNGDTTRPRPASASVDPALLPQIVLPALLAACRDCTTDSRGDAGAWVREAAVAALGRALPPALALAQQAQALEGGGGGTSAAALCRDAVGALLQQALGRIARLRHAALRELRALLPPPPPPTTTTTEGAGTAMVATAAAAAAAATAAYRVLPGAAAVSRAVHAERNIGEAGVASLRAFTAVAELLLLPPAPADPRKDEDEDEGGSGAAAAAACYRYPWLLEGLVAAAGGVDVALARASGRVLARAVSASARGRGTVAAAGAQAATAGGLVQLWVRVQAGGAAATKDKAGVSDAAGSDAAAHARLATPLVRAALLALRKGGRGVAWLPVAGAGADDGSSSTTTPTTVPFAAAVVELLRAEVRGCPDIPRLAEAAALAAELTDQVSRAATAATVAAAAAATAPLPLDRLLALRADAARLLLVLLGNRYPRVRRAAAEAAYMAVLGMRADAVVVVAAEAAAAEAAAPLPGAPALDAAAALLLEGQAWDGADLGGARAARDALADLLGVEPPKAVVAAAGGAGDALAAAAAPPDAAPSAAAAATAAAAAAALLLRSTTTTTAKAAGCRFDENASYQSLLDDAARGGGY